MVNQCLLSQLHKLYAIWLFDLVKAMRNPWLAIWHFKIWSTSYEYLTQRNVPPRHA